MISDGTMDFIVTMAVVLVFIWIVASMIGVNLGDLMVGMRTSKRVQIDAEPRDQAERWLNNHRKSSRDSKPRDLKFAWLTGDLDVPPVKIGRVVGLESPGYGVKPPSTDIRTGRGAVYADCW